MVKVMFVSRFETLAQIHFLEFDEKAIFASPVVKDILATAKETGKLTVARYKGQSTAHVDVFPNVESDRSQTSPAPFSATQASSADKQLCRIIVLAKKIAKCVLHYNLFNPIQFDCISNQIEVYSGDFQTMLLFCRSLLQCAVESDHKVHASLPTIQSVICNTYTPVVTNGHSNSLWNALSLCLVGSEQLRMTLHLLTVFVMVKHKQHCLVPFRQSKW